ncbi:MAG: hypothetical protein Q4B43_06160 [Bacteroidota bacterium]|nr:hypothetical protein [Bacteroidota bacterium]
MEKYRFTDTDYTSHKHYWNETDFFSRNPFGFDISLPYIYEKFGKETAEICLKNYFQSLNTISRENFAKAYAREKENAPWNLEYAVLPDVGMVKFAVEKGLLFL